MKIANFSILWLAQLCVVNAAAGSTDAKVARWLVQEANWGTSSSPISMLHDESTASLTAGVVPFAQDSGRLFFYLIGAKSIDGVALTLSEASLNPNLFSIGACGDEGSEMDAEDPRCAKLTISGDLRPCAADSCSVGEAALFKTHPAMKDWPASHHFTVHELSVKNIWMIANYGGGVVLTPVEYFDATPASFHLEEELKLAEPHDAQIHDVRITEEIPDWSDKVARSRWVVHNSLWTTGESHEIDR